MEADTPANGYTFTEDDLQGIAAAHRLTGGDGRVPLKLGHTDDSPLRDDQPALGWCKDLHVSGGKLLGTFTDIPKTLFDLIKLGNYKFLSVELDRNVTAGTRKIPWMLAAVAVLGATAPAFGSLKDLQSLATMSRAPRLPCESRVTFSIARAESAESVRAEYEVKLSRMKVDGVIEVAIASGQVAPAAREMFRNVFKGDTYTVTNWQQFANTQPRPKLGPAQHSRVSFDTNGNGAPTGEAAAEQLNRLCAVYVEDQRVRFGRTVQLVDAAPIIYRQHPELTRQWHEEQSN